MANTKSAKKAKRQSDRRHVFNLRAQKRLKDALKAFVVTASPESYKLVQKQIDLAAKKGIISEGRAARLKAHLSKKLALKDKPEVKKT